MGKKQNASKVLDGKREGKRPVRKPRRRWEDNIKTNLKKTGCEGTDWIRRPQVGVQWWTFVNTVIELPYSTKSL
jgi:hypothetical protein